MKEEVREVIPHIGPLPIVIPLKLFLDFLRDPVFPRGLTDSQSYVPIFVMSTAERFSTQSMIRVVRDLASNKNGKGCGAYTQSWIIISKVFCSVVTPRTCTDLDRVWVCHMDDGEFEFVYHFNNHLNPFRSFLSLLVVIPCLFVCWQNPIERNCIVKQFKWFNGKRIQTHYPCCITQTRCRFVHVRGVTAEQKTVENHDCAAGRRTFGPPGRGGPWACF